MIFSAAQHSNAAITEMVSSPALRAGGVGGGVAGIPWGSVTSYLLLSASPNPLRSLHLLSP